MSNLMLNQYRERVLRGAKSTKELEIIRAKDTFDKYMRTSPDVKLRYVTDVGEPCITAKTKKEWVSVKDFTENDARALDEKILLTYPDTNIDVGCYVREGNYDWLVTFEEYDPMGIKRHFIMRRCNNTMRIKYKGEFYDIPISIENLTMYSDGVADNIYLSYMDSKKQIWYGNNEVTRTIGENFRIILPHRTAFRVTHINDFEYIGLIKSLVLQTAMLSTDDTENRYADNKLFYKRDYLVNAELPNEIIGKIIGKGNFIIGEEKEFTIKLDDKIGTDNIITWTLDNNSDIAFNIISQSNENIVIASSSDMNLIGKKAKLKALCGDKVIDEITLTLRRI